MPVNANVYTHELDRAALQALKSIPGFTEVLKSFMKVWNEQVFYVQNMSTNLRISEKQLPKYYNMLPPICEKLGIEVPELYVEMNVVPNAYTSGDTKPFIVMTTGLLESMPEELIPSVLAHECGHIACHHVLYRTMGQMILNEAVSLLGLDGLISLPLKIAFYYWMRCSEYSADRAAAICDGGSDKIVEMCMNFAGYNRNIGGEASVEAFLEQAEEYKRLTQDSKWSKTIEFIMFSQATHPLNAVRAYESREWANSEVFSKIMRYTEDQLEEAGELDLMDPLPMDIPMPEASGFYCGKPYQEVEQTMRQLGFTNLELNRVREKQLLVKSGQVLEVLAHRREFAAGDWFPSDVPLRISYYEPATEAEIAAEHPGEIRTPESYLKYFGRNYRQVMNELMDAGFTNIVPEAQYQAKKNFLIKEGMVSRVSIGGQSSFEKGWWFAPDVTVRITYYTYEAGSDFWMPEQG